MIEVKKIKINSGILFIATERFLVIAIKFALNKQTS